MKVFLLVEGDTEAFFIDKVLAPHLPSRALKPIKVTTRSGGAQPRKGGFVTYANFRKQIQNLLKNPDATLVTTMLDYQGLNPDFPGRSGRTERSAKRRVEALEAEMKADFNDPRYVPFICMHEFEALLFSAPAIIADVLRKPALAKPLLDIRCAKKAYQQTPEEINDSPDTSPSARIETLCRKHFGSAKIFQKTLHGPQIAAKIGLEVIQEHCAHFADWFIKLTVQNSIARLIG